MSTVSAPFGLKPSYHPSGEIRPLTTSIASGYANNIFLYSPVALVAGQLELAAAAARAIGTFLGCQYTDSNGRRNFSNKWPAAQVATDIVAWYTADPLITYEIQANGPIAEDDIGEQADWTANTTSSGNTVTGLSSVMLGTPAAGASNGLRIIGITKGPDNDWGDNFTVVNVQISEHQNVADIVGY
jgi:hypothetical protein